MHLKEFQYEKKMWMYLSENMTYFYFLFWRFQQHSIELNLDSNEMRWCLNPSYVSWLFVVELTIAMVSKDSIIIRSRLSISVSAQQVSKLSAM